MKASIVRRGSFIVVVLIIGVSIVLVNRAISERRGERYLQSDAFKRAQEMRRLIDEDERNAQPIDVSTREAGRYHNASIFVWNGALTVRIRTKYPSSHDRAQRYWVYDQSRQCFLPHPMREELEWLIPGEREFAILTQGEHQTLVEYTPKGAREILKAVKFPEEYAIVANQRFIFVVTPHSVWSINGNGGIRSFDSGVYPISVCEATERELIVCSDIGEFGGWITAWPLDEDGNLGKRRLVAQSDFGMNISRSLKDSRGNLWLWGELRHFLHRSEFQLYRPDGELRNLRNQNILRPNAVALDDRAGALILEKNRGILRVNEHGHAKLLWLGRTEISYRDGSSSESVRDEPQGMVVFDNKVYVASTGLGVYEFERTPDGIRFLRQLHLSPEPAIVPEATR